MSQDQSSESERPLIQRRTRREAPDTFTKWLPFLIVLAVVVVSLGGLAMLAVVSVHMQMNRSTASKQSRKMVTRQELTRELQGKSEKEVMARIGRPDSTTSRIRSWHYQDRSPALSYDPVTGLTDGSLFIYFDDEGRVRDISFHSR